MIATYNQPDYIGLAVQSALAQDYPNLEVIVSDDSTNNDTEVLLNKFKNDNRFHYYKNPVNIGRVKNYRKLLFELAKGDWVIMLDGDDFYVDPGYISKAMSLVLAEQDLVLVGAGINVLNEDTGVATPRPLIERSSVFAGEEVFQQLLFLPNHQTDLYKKKLACELDFYRDPSMGSDSESLFRLCLQGKVAYLEDIVATWRIHTQNTTFTRDLDKQIREVVFIDRVAEYASSRLDKKVISRWRNHMYQMMSNHFLGMATASGRKGDIRKVLFRFFKYFNRPQITQLAARLIR